VHNFQSIDLLLLTTKVGGLGLNLTGADVVIFMEHDWNPGDYRKCDERLTCSDTFSTTEDVL
jgi:SNF2 family DNA or RNA helicase